MPYKGQLTKPAVTPPATHTKFLKQAKEIHVGYRERWEVAPAQLEQMQVKTLYKQGPRLLWSTAWVFRAEGQSSVRSITEGCCPTCHAVTACLQSAMSCKTYCATTCIQKKSFFTVDQNAEAALEIQMHAIVR